MIRVKAVWKSFVKGRPRQWYNIPPTEQLLKHHFDSNLYI